MVYKKTHTTQQNAQAQRKQREKCNKTISIFLKGQVTWCK